MMQRNPQQFAMSKELHTLARGQKIAGVRPFQNLDEAGKKRRTNYTVELAVALMQARAMNPGKLPSEAFGESILGMGVGIASDRAVEQTWLTLCTERVNAPDAPNYPDSLGPVCGSFFAVYHDVAVASGDGSPLFAVSLRRMRAVLFRVISRRIPCC